MKVQFRSILFALVVPAAACGGDRETSTVTTTQPNPFAWEPRSAPAEVSKPTQLGEQPKLVEIKAPLPTKYDELLAMGRDLIAKQSYGDAKEMLEAAIKLDKKAADPHVEMARMYIAMNEKGKAIASAKQATKLAPLSSQAWNTKGRAELTAHNYDNAVEAFSKAVELNEDNAFAWNNLGYTELLLKQYEDAALHLGEATARKGATGYMFNNLGTALEHLDRLDEARVAYEAGGKIGSQEAAASRKRLEGVTTIAIATIDTPVTAESEVMGSPAKAKEYDLTDEGDSVDTTEPASAVEPDVTEDAGTEEPEVDEHADLGDVGGDMTDEPSE